MKKIILLGSASFFAASLIAQVQVDKALQLTGTGSDAKISGIKDVSSAQDAVSAEVIQNNNLTYVTGGGSANAYTATLAPAITSYVAGQIVSFKAGVDNTAASTLNVNGLGVKTIKKNFNTDLTAGDIKNGQVVTVIYDGTTFQMISQTGTASGGGGSCPTVAIGDSYGGGKVAAIDYPGSTCRILIAGNADKANGTWGCSGTWVGGTFDGFGLGAHSSALVSAACGGVASTCESLVEGGFSDWFLPNKEEINQLYNKRTAIGGFNTSAAPPYTTSSEFTTGQQWTLSFTGGGYNSGGYNKNDSCRVRCVRAL